MQWTANEHAAGARDICRRRARYPGWFGYRGEFCCLLIWKILASGPRPGWNSGNNTKLMPHKVPAFSTVVTSMTLLIPKANPRIILRSKYIYHCAILAAFAKAMLFCHKHFVRLPSSSVLTVAGRCWDLGCRNQSSPKKYILWNCKTWALCTCAQVLKENRQS